MKNIMLKIIGKQMGKGGEEEVIELITEGKYYRKGDTTYLVYQETELSGIEGCVTTLKITDDLIKMKRFGTASSEIQFEKGKRFNTHYNTPYGNVEMEVVTKRIENALNIQDVTGSLKIEYDISLQGLVEGKNKINIEIMKNRKN
ncbi:MAG: DUF1934 domain-containing protein [Clostridia bacterium]|nr:DUF1934 domain-containing protein [Clostridia bacterium]